MLEQDNLSSDSELGLKMRIELLEIINFKPLKP